MSIAGSHKYIACVYEKTGDVVKETDVVFGTVKALKRWIAKSFDGQVHRLCVGEYMGKVGDTLVSIKVTKVY